MLNLIFKFLIFFILSSNSLFAALTVCPGNNLTTLEGTSTSKTLAGSDIAINAYTTHYYHFTPVVSGKLKVDTLMNVNYNSLYIKDGCGTTLTSQTDNSNSKSVTVDIVAGQQVVIAYERRWSTDKTYSMTIAFTATDPKTVCPGNTIVNLDGTTVSAIDNDSGTITGDTTYYYNFTPNEAGTIQVDSYVSASYNSLYIKDGCGANLWSNTNNSTSKSSSEISVSAGQLIVIALERRYNSDRSFTINFDFKYTAPTPPTISNIPNQTATVNIVYSLDLSTYVIPTNNDPILTYTLTGTLPDGLEFDTTSGFISGTPTMLESQTLSLTATDKDGISEPQTFTLSITPPYNESYDGRTFDLRHQESLFGNVTMIGNTVICYRGSSGTGNCQDTTTSNGNTYLYKTPESYSTLSLPTNAEVKYARVYWQGRNTTRNDWTEADKNSAKVLQMRQEDDTFTVINADVLDISDDGYNTYSASADVTSYIQTHGEGKYYVNPTEFYTITGKPDGLGAYGAWVLVVVYEDEDDTTARNITIFDGYEIIDGSNSVDISVSGFLTPKKWSCRVKDVCICRRR